MVFLAGPRQVGKTTTALQLERKKFYYYNWDNPEDKKSIISGPDRVAYEVGLDEAKETTTFIIFDEIHKYSKWKQFLKAFFDLYQSEIKIVVTGSAKLDVYQRGGDSMMGRYFLYRIHPLSVRELISTAISETLISPPKKISNEKFMQLFNFGGFPEPFLKKNKRFSTNWKRLRQLQLIQEDIRDVTQIQELSGLEMLCSALQSSIGQLTNYNCFSNLINVSNPTIRRWFNCLESFYFCFHIRPWTQNVIRTLKREPKYYLWDWSLVMDLGVRVENFIASHLLKAVHFWTDYGFGEFDLFFLRDKEKREVDFLVTRDGKPWFIAEVKSKNHSGISKSLYHFQEQTKALHAFQIVFDMDFVNQDCFSYDRPIIVSAQTLLSQLV